MLYPFFNALSNFCCSMWQMLMKIFCNVFLTPDKASYPPSLDLPVLWIHIHKFNWISLTLHQLILILYDEGMGVLHELGQCMYIH